ncbi:hypothetical protein KFK09_027451 [Dendrobium nobile]|uniref:Uncharacterized protein n=1 Tax=Dendrobium nobile TaxID=94219 RepID=A0A8T3AG07_DENNO|nr:hypothetical protein KFK09_027451 [Dendrobium nobile]
MGKPKDGGPSAIWECNGRAENTRITSGTIKKIRSKPSNPEDEEKFLASTLGFPRMKYSNV